MDLPRKELLEAAERALNMHPNANVYFKFTCCACGERCTFVDPNVLYERGECSACGFDQPVNEGGFCLEVKL